MSTVATIHTLVPKAVVPIGYFDEDNIQFIQDLITQVLRREFSCDVRFDRASIIRLMERVITDRIENVPAMNERVVMYATNEYRNHQLEVDKHLRWEGGYVQSQRLYDPTVEVSRFDRFVCPPPNRLGKPRVGGTVRFYFS